MKRPAVRRNGTRRLAALAALVTFTAGCDLAPHQSNEPGSTAAAGPAGPPVLGIDWARAGSVERPVNFDATMPPGDQRTHPILRVPGQAIMADVAPIAGRGLLAVGYVPPTWYAAAWTSTDGTSWAMHELDPTTFTFAVSVATAADGSAVAVGRSGPLPVAWTSADGATWQRESVPVLGSDGVAERMTTVVATDHGYVAGGSVGPELFERHARFWTSPDGHTWQPVADDAAAFAGAEVRSITRFAGGLVAVGVVGTAQKPEDAVAWTSKDGTSWTRVDDPALKNGVAVSVTPMPAGGVVAVGSDPGRREAVAWVSADGRHWVRAPTEPSRQYPGYVWMTDVGAIGDELLAVGTYQGLQRGTATAWISHDGLTWQQARTAPVQEQGDFYALAPLKAGAIAVGSFGGPDSYVPTVWFTPAR
jgi:hypothetical protein